MRRRVRGSEHPLLLRRPTAAANSGRISHRLAAADWLLVRPQHVRPPRGSRARRAERPAHRPAPFARQFVHRVLDRRRQVGLVLVAPSGWRPRRSPSAADGSAPPRDTCRPDTSITGARLRPGRRRSARRSARASIVAEVTITFRSPRRGPRQQLAQVAEQEIDVQAALVRLVDDDACRTAQQRVASASRPAGCRRSSA
jgi:hypothetical protein